ncbi:MULTISPECIES: GNAT family N-acetyltransferase [unclassified Rubrivivax]|uniref:GNAT family N-acetyltransferase n=1 Tax=unclassified Rubrivivax TaxID=2649762 RepID=UPI001E517928|nr:MULTISPECIES: GNAT family N-acetyltransferase [unclassified Rubrivivax]MCC9598454.1 GNAT family N-acetyltransferase [Rubrivivax sp. JA1055]MCC9648154.1 GNAT family N-acetyltransferase [Rubrivivax sp. JA1029]
MTLPTPALEVRSARPEDRALVDAMMVPYLRGFGAEGPYPGLERYGSDPRCEAFLLWLDGAAAGFALLEQVDAGTTELVEFYVAAQYRQQGCGRRAADRLFALRPGRWRVGVRQDNGAALVFWRAVLTGKPGLTVREHARPPAWIYEFDASV